ncbi:MAG: phytoene/squalene synthase family protein, partial [Alphaproteobacteria bacterium]|nr:phytoene/squalene synthase family protein [Alphaproteobacteria bacterium]
MASTSASSAPSHAPIVDGMLRESDRKRWLACLFIPQAVREHVIALHAFSHEITRVRDVISEPQLGEIRLQWWREAIEGSREGEALLNPVAAVLLNAMRICNLPQAPLLNLIEARRFDLYNDAMPDLATLEGYCGETHSALFALTARILETA